VIAPLRRSHLAIWLALSAILPLVLIAGLLARRPATPENSNLLWSRIK